MSKPIQPLQRARSLTRTSYLFGLTLLVGVYFFSAKVALLLAVPPGYATGIWPPSGIALAVVLLFGKRVWPGIWLGAALTNLTIQGSPLLATLIGAGNTLEALVAASFVQRYVDPNGAFASAKSVFMFVGLTMLSAVTAAAVGAISLTLTGTIPANEFTTDAWIWFQGDATGMMILTPVILIWSRGPLPKLTIAKWAEASALTLLIALATALIFGQTDASNALQRLTFTLFPLVIWVAIRFEQRGVVTSISAICGGAVFYTLQGKGYFALGSAPIISFYLLSYTAILFITGLTLSVFIEQLKHADAIVRQRMQELQENQRRIDEFLAMLSHELRNPLAPIANALAIVRRDPSRQTDVLNILERQVGHLKHIVDDLLDVSRITRGKVRLQTETIELNRLVGRTLDSVRHMIEARHHNVDVGISQQKILVEADETRINQVVLNLLSNAIKYTPSGGRISVSLQSEEEFAVLKISDDGIGIAPELVSKVFELFVQGDRSLDRSEGGLGIGLTIAKSIVEMHKGTIRVSSEGPGRGAEFEVRLPIKPMSLKVASEEQVTAASDSTKRRILVVDDNRDSADSLSTLMAVLGHDVKAVYDGPESIEMAKHFRPDTVLLDIGLPGMDGYEVAQRLRSLEGGEHLTIIAVSGYAQDKDRQRSWKAGFNHHLVKPVNIDELIKVLSAKDGR